MKEINFSKIEKKWQKKWEEGKIFEVKEKGNKFYVLEMYPYPSGSGLHMGHAFNYTIGDIYARFKRMQGFNVLYPMGFDSFGLPAENAAIKNKSHPKKFTEDAIKNFIKQMKELGLSYDWSRMIETHKPEYYKWDQWIFLKMFEKKLAYRKESSVNWCPKCKTVLANEQVHDGKCWRHQDTEVETKELEQWFFKTTKYSDELYEEINNLNWPERIKAMQRNWIGKKEWIDINYKVDGTNEKVVVSTTRPDTNFGATFVVMAPEHPLLSKEKNLIPEEKRKPIDDYINKTKAKTEQERIEEANKKTGVFTGLYCVNQLTNKKMPIWVTDFVLMSVGTGAVVGVPGHDVRDFDFAKEFDLPIVRVVVGSDGDKSKITRREQVQEEEGTMINSGFLDGMNIHDATKKIMDYLEENKSGKRAIRYRLKDWLISRQRFWGTPIPIIYCDKCGIVPVPEKDLPVLLPEDIKFTSASNPLKDNKEFIETTCPKCNSPAKRETDTMDTFVNSSWYFLRYTDPQNNKEIFNPKKTDYWMPIDLYIGGAEHACMHLIYFRFYTKFLRDIGLLKIDEPAKKLFNQGMLHGPDGVVMSKSRGNVVLPEEISNKYGIDTARFFLMSIASPDKDLEWSDKGIQGSYRFIKKVINYFSNVKPKQSSSKVESKINKAIKKITENIENMKYNLAVIELRNLFESFEEETGKKDLESFLKLLHPFCPHITEELWEKLNNKPFISLQTWPELDETKINKKFEEEEKAFEKLKQDIANIKKITGHKKAKAYVYVLPHELELYKDFQGAEVFAVNDFKKHDPKDKAKKAKPGKPAIYIE